MMKLRKTVTRLRPQEMKVTGLKAVVQRQRRSRMRMKKKMRAQVMKIQQVANLRTRLSLKKKLGVMGLRGVKEMQILSLLQLKIMIRNPRSLLSRLLWRS